MDLHRILSLLLTLESAGKLEGRSLPTLYDANGDITLTVRAVDVATREQFLADVAGAVDEAASEPEAVAEPAKPKKKIVIHAKDPKKAVSDLKKAAASGKW